MLQRPVEVAGTLRNSLRRLSRGSLDFRAAEQGHDHIDSNSFLASVEQLLFQCEQ